MSVMFFLSLSLGSGAGGCAQRYGRTYLPQNSTAQGSWIGRFLSLTGVSSTVPGTKEKIVVAATTIFSLGVSCKTTMLKWLIYSIRGR